MVLIAYGIVQFLGAISIVFRPFIFAAIIVLVLRPMLNALERRGMPRALALGLSYVSFFVVLALILLFIVPLIVNEINQLVRAFPAYSKMIQRGIIDLQDKYRTFKLPSQANQVIQNALSSSQKTFVGALSEVPTFTVSILNLILDFIIGPIIAFFVLIDRARISHGFARAVPKAIKAQTLYIVYRLNIALTAVLRTMAIIAMSLGTLYSIGLAVIGVPYALLIGFLAGFLELIPYVGPLVGLVIAVVVTLATKSGWAALGIGIYFFVLGQLESTVLTPILMKGQVGVPPLLTVTILLVGGALFGFWGVFLALPIAAVVYEIGAFFLMEKDERDAAVKASTEPEPAT